MCVRKPKGFEHAWHTVARMIAGENDRPSGLDFENLVRCGFIGSQQAGRFLLSGGNHGRAEFHEQAGQCSESSPTSASLGCSIALFVTGQFELRQLRHRPRTCNVVTLDITDSELAEALHDILALYTLGDRLDV